MIAKIARCLVFSLAILSIPMVAEASVCLDLSTNISRYQESSTILKVQNFFFEQGYLKAKPNGYFGAGTYAAVKAYQRDNGFSQVGVIGPATRAALKRDTCTSSSSVSPQNSQPTPSQTVTTTQSPQTQPSQQTSTQTSLPLTKNEQRFQDLEKLLRALYNRTKEYGGVYPVAQSSTSTELCVKPPYVMPTGTTTEVAVLITPDSPCLNYADISYLMPNYLTYIPRDPVLASSSILTGYTMMRSEYNDVTLEAKNTDNGAIIKVRCNFNAGCPKIDRISSIEYGVPSITSIDRPIFLSGSTLKDPITITGKNFTAKNNIYLFSSQLAKEYYVGQYASTDGVTIPLVGSDLNKTLNCGTGCSQKLALGDYSLTVKNEGGTSNASYIRLKAFTTSSLSTHGNTSVTPKTKAVQLGSFTISSTIPVKLVSLTLTSTSTSTVLPSKIGNFYVKDTLTGLTYGLGDLGNVTLYENQSKLYELYADIDEVLLNEYGYITYGGFYTVTDALTGATMYLPSKEISFTVSY